MNKKYKIIKFKPIFFKKELKKVWQQYDFYLDFEKEWKNFLDICGNNKIERIFALNNFLITEFLMAYCELKPRLLNNANCYCSETLGKIKIIHDNYDRHEQIIKNFLGNFRLRN